MKRSVHFSSAQPKIAPMHGLGHLLRCFRFSNLYGFAVRTAGAFEAARSARIASLCHKRRTGTSIVKLLATASQIDRTMHLASASLLNCVFTFIVFITQFCTKEFHHYVFVVDLFTTNMIIARSKVT